MKPSAKVVDDAQRLAAKSILLHDQLIAGSMLTSAETCREVLSLASKLHAVLAAYRDLFDEASSIAEVDRALRRPAE